MDLPASKVQEGNPLDVDVVVCALAVTSCSSCTEQRSILITRGSTRKQLPGARYLMVGVNFVVKLVFPFLIL